MRTAVGVIDHVIVGRRGLHAVNVVARRTQRRHNARIRENNIEWEDGSKSESIVELAAKTARLQKEFRDLLGHKLRVRSVVAVPGWDIGEQLNKQHLLVNERTIAMLSGWNDQSDHLMNEDVDFLQKELTARCGFSSK